jgi:hypothetical protein
MNEIRKIKEVLYVFVAMIRELEPYCFQRDDFKTWPSVKREAIVTNDKEFKVSGRQFLRNSESSPILQHAL